MKCATCQTENPDTAKFCNNCGASLESARDAQEIPVPVEKPKKRPRWLLIVGAIVTLCVIGAIFAALLSSPPAEPAPTAPVVADPTEELQSTETPSPTYTVSATHTASPTDTPTPADTPTARPTRTPTATVDSSAALREFTDAVSAELFRMSDGMDRISALFMSPDLNDNNWLTDVASAVVTIQFAYENLQGMDVAPEFQDLHEIVLAATVDCYDAMDYLVSGIDNRDAGDLEIAVALITSCNSKMSEATDMLNSGQQ